MSSARALVQAELTRIFRLDVHPGDHGNNGKHYWTKDPEGLAKWADHPHPWTALHQHVMKFAGITPQYADRITSQWFHDVFGYWPGDRKGKNPVGPRSLRVAQLVAAEIQNILGDGQWDDDPIGDIDDQTVALVQALEELQAELSGRAWDPAKHPRDPATGHFVALVDRLKAAISLHQSGVSGKAHPLDGFSRPQLLKAAKLRGIAIKRGEDRDSIAAKLLNDLTKNPSAPSAPSAPSVPGTNAAHKITAQSFPWMGGINAEKVSANGNEIGVVVPTPGGQFMAFPPTNSGLMPPPGGPWKSRQDAIDALIRQALPAPGQNLPPGARKVSGPGLAGLKLAEAKVPSNIGGWNGKQTAKWSYAAFSDGVHIGGYDFWGGHYTATNIGGNPVHGSSGNYTFKTKSEALLALVSKMPNPPTPSAAKSSASGPVVPVSPVGVHGPEITAALDILFDKDPKGHTVARQLEVYTALKRNQFDQLGHAEQSTVLGDLSFIASKSKGANAAKAQKLVDRFTPPGTSHGQIPNQAIHVPASALANQTRVADPAGTPDLLTMKPASQRGLSGDGFTRTATGKTGPWGKYGAAGLMLRHVDANGEERFLMVQRGPGISDPGMWQFPGGAKEQKENFYEGATREVIEELGFKPSDLDTARVHGTHTAEVQSVTVPGLRGGNVPWAYVSIAATVDKQIKPDLSTHHAQLETSDAKWMTRAEIAKLDTKGKLLKPLAGGALQTNVMTLFPSFTSLPAPAPAKAGPSVKRPPRLTGAPAVNAPKQITHKPSPGRDLVSDKAAHDKLRQDVKKARSLYAGKTGDDRLAAIGAIQGFDDVPTVATKDEMDRLLATGNYIEAWRGVKGIGGGYTGPTRGGAISRTKTAAQINEEFRSGPAYYGKGIFGNGYYFATMKDVAKTYADGTPGSTVRVLIPKSANVIGHDSIRAEAQRNSSQFSKAKGKSHEESTLWDEGRYAAAKGHDAIVIKYNSSSNHVASAGKPAYNILNRSMLIVEEA